MKVIPLSAQAICNLSLAIQNVKLLIVLDYFSQTSLPLERMALPPPVRDVREEDVSKLLQLADETGLFTQDELQSLLAEPLLGILRGSLGKEHHARVVLQQPCLSPIGWTYLAPEEGGDVEKYELFWIGVKPTAQRAGYGTALLADAETLVKAAGGTQLTICTSSTPGTEKARAFYARQGYLLEPIVVSDFYGPGDDKLTFVKRLSVV